MEMVSRYTRRRATPSPPMQKEKRPRRTRGRDQNRQCCGSFRYCLSRACWSEMKVHADTSNVALDDCAGSNVCTEEGHGGGVELRELWQRVAHGAEIVVEVFAFQRPLRRDHPFKSAASGPPRQGRR